MLGATLGNKNNNDRWDDYSIAHINENVRLAWQDLDDLHSRFDYSKLEPPGQLDYRVFEADLKLRIKRDSWRYHFNPLNQIVGLHLEIPGLLTAYHTIDSLDDARAYISRVQSVGTPVDQFYQFLLGQFTTTDITADEVHELGLREVRRIHEEMDRIRTEVGFTGDLTDFFSHVWWSNTASSAINNARAVDRNLAVPGQATAFKIGMMRILDVRQKARSALGDKFDIREFHQVILENGPIPLSIMEEQVQAWVKKKQTR